MVRVSSMKPASHANSGSQLPETCMRVYFSDDYTISEYIIVNASLHLLFWGVDHLIPSPDGSTHAPYALMCGKNIEVALANLPLHMPTDMISIMALISGVRAATSHQLNSLGLC
jgi:hypothetical protein